MWFKVEVNKDGSVATCEQVDVSLKSGVSVVYIEAESKEKAIEKAVAYVERIRLKARRSYEKNREKILAADRARRAARAKAGICSRCDEKAVASGYCEAHRVVYNEQRAAAKRDKRRGIFVKKTTSIDPLQRAASIKAGRNESNRRANRGLRRKVRLSAFREALGFYDANPNTFRAWLTARIVELQEAITLSQATEDLPVAAE